MSVDTLSYLFTTNMLKYFLLAIYLLLVCSNTVRAQSSFGPTVENAAKIKWKPKPYSNPLPDSVKQRRLSSGETSIERLCQLMLLAVEKRDTAQLLKMIVTQKEYKNWIWPEQAINNPKANVPVSFVWGNIVRKDGRGIDEMIAEYGGKKLNFVSIDFKENDLHQTYIIHDGAEVTFTDDQGITYTVKNVGAVIEMNNLFKFLYYRQADN